jgi:hypothetical protein
MRVRAMDVSIGGEDAETVIMFLDYFKEAKLVRDRLEVVVNIGVNNL